VPVATLRYWRHLGSGPQSFRIGRTVRYWRSDVYQWLESQSRRSQASH
jgi:predicted DNA-binding transcriptional regulator AlpA